MKNLTQLRKKEQRLMARLNALDTRAMTDAQRWQQHLALSRQLSQVMHEITLEIHTMTVEALKAARASERRAAQILARAERNTKG